MGVKSVETLGSKIRVSSGLGHIFFPFPRNNVDISISSTAQTKAPAYLHLFYFFLKTL